MTERTWFVGNYRYGIFVVPRDYDKPWEVYDVNNEHQGSFPTWREAFDFADYKTNGK